MSTCPACRENTHSPRHLFACPSHPTPLSVDCLWTQLIAAAEFITALPFYDLPPLDRPPPEPPPEHAQPEDVG